MKTIDNFIYEKLKLNSQSKLKFNIENIEQKKLSIINYIINKFVNSCSSLNKDTILYENFSDKIKEWVFNYINKYNISKRDLTNTFWWKAPEPICSYDITWTYKSLGSNTYYEFIESEEILGFICDKKIFYYFALM